MLFFRRGPLSSAGGGAKPHTPTPGTGSTAAWAVISREPWGIASTSVWQRQVIPWSHVNVPPGKSQETWKPSPHVPKSAPQAQAPPGPAAVYRGQVHPLPPARLALTATKWAADKASSSARGMGTASAPSTSGGTSQPHRHLSPDTGQKMCWEPGRQVTRPFCRCLRAWAPSDSPAAKSPSEQTGRLRARIGVRGEKRLLSKTCKSGVHSSPEHPQYPVSAKHPLKPMLLLATESKRQPETCAVSNRPMSSMFPSEKANL